MPDRLSAARRSVRAGLPLLVLIVAGAWSIAVAPASTASSGADAPRSSAAWQQFHGDAGKTGWNRSEHVLAVDNVHRLKERWAVADGQLTGSPIVVGSQTFAVVGNTDANGQMVSELVAVDRVSGDVNWTAPLFGNPAFPPAALAFNGLVLVVTNGVLEGYQADTGTLAAVITVGQSRGPTVSGSSIYLGSADHNVYAISATDLSARWHTELPAEIDSLVAVSDHRVFAVAGDELFALDAATGAILWHSSVGTVFGGGPAVVDDVVYVAADVPSEGSGLARLVALDARSGRRLWSADAGDDVHSVPAVDGRQVYIGAINGEVHAYDRKTGKLRWTRNLSGEIWSSIAVANGVIYLDIDTGTAFALRARTGATLWSATPTGTGAFATVSSPAVADGMLFVGYGAAGFRGYGVCRHDRCHGRDDD